MDTASLKIELIKKIIVIDDIVLLEKINQFLDDLDSNYLELNEPSTVYEKGEKVYVFNEWQQEKINRALKQIEDGACISDEEAEKEIQRWFKEEEKLYGQ